MRRRLGKALRIAAWFVVFTIVLNLEFFSCRGGAPTPAAGPAQGTTIPGGESRPPHDPSIAPLSATDPGPVRKGFPIPGPASAPASPSGSDKPAPPRTPPATEAPAPARPRPAQDPSPDTKAVPKPSPQDKTTPDRSAPSVDEQGEPDPASERPAPGSYHKDRPPRVPKLPAPAAGDLTIAHLETIRKHTEDGGLPKVPEAFARLDGTRVTLTGYVFVAFDDGAPPAEFHLCLHPWDACCIGRAPTVFNAVAVRMAEGVKPAGWRRWVLRLSGTLRVRPVHEDGVLTGLYVLEDARESVEGAK